MSLFQLLAYFSPLLLGFGIPAALALTAGQPPKRRAIAAGSVAGGVLVLLLLASFTDSPKLWFPLTVLLISVGLFIAGLYLLLESARAPRELSQIVCGLVLCALMSTLFWTGPLIRAVADRGASGESIYRRISVSLDLNPLFVTAYSIFDVDLLHKIHFYKMGMADFQHGTPAWGVSSAGFAVAGLVLASVAVGLRRAFKP